MVLLAPGERIVYEGLVDDYASGDGSEGGSDNCKLKLKLGAGENARLPLMEDFDELAGEKVELWGEYVVPSWLNIVRDTVLGDSVASCGVVGVYDGVLCCSSEAHDGLLLVEFRPVLILLKSRLSLVSHS